MSGTPPPAGLAVEVGGTSIRAAVVGPQGDLVQPVARADTPNHLDGRDHGDLQETVLAAMQQLAAGVLDGAGPDSVCVAYPGPMDAAGHVLATPTVLAVNKSSPYRTFAELVTAARADPGKLTLGSGGGGTPALTAGASAAAPASAAPVEAEAFPWHDPAISLEEGLTHTYHWIEKQVKSSQPVAAHAA